MIPWGCWRDSPLHHPWQPIQDVACGSDARLTDPRCIGCHRSRPESALDQLRALQQVGAAELAKGAK